MKYFSTSPHFNLQPLHTETDVSSTELHGSWIWISRLARIRVKPEKPCTLGTWPCRSESGNRKEEGSYHMVTFVVPFQDILNITNYPVKRRMTTLTVLSQFNGTMRKYTMIGVDLITKYDVKQKKQLWQRLLMTKALLNKKKYRL